MRFFIVFIALSLSGCAKNLYFGTYTRAGIEASTDGAGIGLKNAAVNIAPPKKDGTPFDVLGNSDIDLSFTDVILHKEIAVGDAAKCAAVRSKAEMPEEVKVSLSGQSSEAAVGPVIFGAHTAWSLFEANWGQAAPQGIHFGYKRSVGVKMPIVNDSLGPVYANVTVNTSDKDESKAPKSAIGGTRSKHVFATGHAAIIKAAGRSKELNGSDASYAGCLK